MKSRNPGPLGKGGGGRSSPMRIPQVPMEWMDPMSWRLPSGKALAEFALQAGFLAPLMFGTPSFSKRKKKSEAPVKSTERAETARAVGAGLDQPIGEVPDNSGTFRGKK